MGVCTGDSSLMQLQKSETFSWSKETSSLFLSRRNSSPRECRSDQNTLNSGICLPCNHNCVHSRKRSGSSPAYSNLYQILEHPNFIEESSMNIVDSSQTQVPDLLTEMKCENLMRTESRGVTISSKSPPGIMIGPDDCAGCGQLIKDRFYLLAIEKRWHAGCLQCHICRRPLDRETSCFSKDGNIYCKGDYYRAFGTRKCSKCYALISSSELVMRVRNLVFHIDCFSCTVCHTLLTKGEEFGLRDSSIFCRLHYELSAESQPTHLNSLPNSCSITAQFGIVPTNPSSPGDVSKLTSAGFYVSAAQFVAGLSQSSRQKGRPRKRKPKDMETIGSKLNLNTEYLDFGRGSHLGTTSRTKRMRTSFKHHQLRTMKSYFAINHNPDAKDLKQLSQKTGLPKRVLQVWFQNARAKWRRMMMKQDGKNTCEKNEISLDVEAFNFRSSRSTD